MVRGDSRNRDLVERLRKAGVNFKSELYQPRAKAGPFAKQKRSCSPARSRILKREEAAAKIEAAAARRE